MTQVGSFQTPPPRTSGLESRATVHVEAPRIVHVSATDIVSDALISIVYNTAMLTFAIVMFTPYSMELALPRILAGAIVLEAAKEVLIAAGKVFYDFVTSE